MKRTIRLTESDLKNIIKESVNKILKEECEDIERTFYNWAFGGGCKNHRLGGAINPAQWLYEYYYEDDDDALYRAAEEFSDEFGCDIDEVYEVARKAANNYFHYNPDYEREEMNNDDEVEGIEECVKRSLKESLSKRLFIIEKKVDDKINKRRAVLEWLRHPEVNCAEIRRQLEGEPESQEEEDAKRSYFMKKVNETDGKRFTDEEINTLYALKSKLGY